MSKIYIAGEIKERAFHSSCKKREAEILIVRSVFKVNADTLEAFPNLKTVAELGTGLDHIDLDLCKRHNIRVINAPGVNAVSVAEFTVMQILNIYKNSYMIYERAKKKDYRRALYYGKELRNATVGIIGYGHVGKNIAIRLSPFVKKIYLNDISPRLKSDPSYLNLEALVGISDIVILAVDARGNNKMVNKAFLSRLKKTALLVNIARGSIIDESFLVKFLKKNKRVFYYCDVFAKEPDYKKKKQDYDNPLLHLPNVLFTPHIAGMTEESQRNIINEIRRKLWGKKGM